jgi:hypothetical protein
MIDIPRVTHSTHPTPGAAHKAAGALSARTDRFTVRIEKWTEAGGWIAIDTYVNGKQQEN